jgi:hypothetical protein
VAGVLERFLFSKEMKRFFMATKVILGEVDVDLRIVATPLNWLSLSSARTEVRNILRRIDRQSNRGAMVPCTDWAHVCALLNLLERGFSTESPSLLCAVVYPFVW